ncbi:Ribokinase-like protein [Aspergillus karnatakaensis]|uniref:ribokinase n=1 Tax=Aspergillus karnatakaensis TaxID=1810916 RepID=UPI003CCE03D3
MPPPPLIQIIGSLNTDITTLTPRIPSPGETLTATSTTLSPGGKGGNQAVAVGRASFTSPGVQDIDVEMIGAVGGDDEFFARIIEPVLNDSGVRTGLVREIKGAMTGRSIIIVDEGRNGENRIMFVPGANYEGMRDAAAILGVESVLQDAGGVSGTTEERVPDVVVMQGEIPAETTFLLLRHFNEPGRKTAVVFNPAPMYTEGIPVDALVGVAALVVNETEAVLLSRWLNLVLPLDLEQEGEEVSMSAFDPLADSLLHLGVRNLVVTLGGQGVYFANGCGVRGHVPAWKVERVVDTTAAGDTFTGFFAAYLARHLGCGSGGGLNTFDVKGAVKYANRAAAKCVQRSGSMGSIPYGYEC